MKNKVFLIYSGKGGVGKSTVTYNTAYELKNKGYRVGVLDLDLKTPSLYRLFNGAKQLALPQIESDLKIKPANIDGILVQSTGFINNNTGIFFDDGLIEGALYQLLHDSLMEVDYLLIDLPPSIEKLHSLICQKFKNAEFLLVSTYSLLALEDTQKALSFINKLDRKVNTVVMNMSYIKCNSCSEKNYIFNKSNIDKFKELQNFRILELPLSKELVDMNERSQTVNNSKDSDLLKPFNELINNI